MLALSIHTALYQTLRLPRLNYAVGTRVPYCEGTLYQDEIDVYHYMSNC